MKETVHWECYYSQEREPDDQVKISDPQMSEERIYSICTQWNIYSSAVSLRTKLEVIMLNEGSKNNEVKFTFHTFHTYVEYELTQITCPTTLTPRVGKNYSF